MKLSKKLKKDLKKRILISISSIAILLMLIAGSKLADFSASFEKLMMSAQTSQIAGSTAETTEIAENNSEISEGNNTAEEYATETLSTVSENSDVAVMSVSEANRLQNTDTVTYIYDAADLVAFRNAVNAGDNYSGKTVYLMADIDMSTVCSATVGSWVPIGATGTTFAGTFNGNYHTISNLYISSGAYQYLGLFTINGTNAIIQNLLIEDITLYNSYSVQKRVSYTGGIAGHNQGTIQNCGMKSGNISIKHDGTTVSGTWLQNVVGGITGNSSGVIANSYNNATVSGNSSYTGAANYVETFSGGISGKITGKIENCYNSGSISAYSNGNSYAAGITGRIEGINGSIKNSYNYGAISATSRAYYNYGNGIAGWNGYNTSTAGKITNAYCITNTTYSYRNYASSNAGINVTTGRIAAETLKTYTVTLGSSFAYDVYNQNSGYPVLAWQNETTVMKLNRNQEYIKIGEKLQLNVVESDEVTEIIGNNYANSNFKWTSTNEDVATINENGVVTGISDGYTTVYAYHETSGLYAMAVINVAKDFTNPQIETGNGFTAILKSDGTVWTIGNNASGQLGNGDTENSKAPVQVHMDEDTLLSNIVKISVGTDHVLALTKDGKVYAWGANTDGQLGQNNTDSTTYAKAVLGEDGASYLSNIVDISAGAFGSMVLDKNGNVYVWGRGTNGEIGNYATTSKYLPTKTTIKNAIQVSMGGEYVGALTSEGVVWSWGKNNTGKLGINCVNNTSYPMKTALNVTDVQLGAVHTIVKKIDETVYAAGHSNYGTFGSSSTANATKYVTVNLPSAVTEENKVKYIKAGRLNTTLLLADGTVWETGFNLQGELGNGTTTVSTSFVQGLTENGAIENVLTIGKNNGNIEGSTTTGYGLNTAVITKDGDIYTTGDNSYGQIGDNTTINKTYYTKMGFAYLDYEEKTVEIDENEYQIDLNKLKYVYSSINAYNNEQTYSLGEIKYTSSDETIATVDENGKVTPKDGASGITQIKIEDVTNNYETYFTVIVNKLQNTDTITYIYTAEDMVEFRDSVNAGDSYAGKTVYVMVDIDMSSVCSATVGSWEPIGTYVDSEGKAVYFAGTFDGNYHTISNLYINSSTYQNLGLFTINGTNAIIQNLLIEDITLYNSYSVQQRVSNTGGIAGYNQGTIQNCGMKSGNISIKHDGTTVRGTWLQNTVGGITGNSSGVIANSYNNATISGNSTYTGAANYVETFSGGISGKITGKIENCYNSGSVSASSNGHSYAAGITGRIEKNNGSIKNSYNYGAISATSRAYNNYGNGIAGWNGYTTSTAGNITNTYCTTNTTYSYRNYASSNSGTNVTTGRIAAATLKTYSTTLGKAFENDDFNINSGYPILWWQAPTIELNKKQEYIKVGEQIQLSIIQNEAVTTVFADEIDTSSFVWTSTNEDIATVDSNGLVTGVSDGYTTIYGYNQANNIYVMCVVNVYENEANPQVESGEGFTAILKADGTVWTIGKNENGELGDGTNEERIEAVQVKTDENTYLSNVVKISAGTSHVLALTKDGKIYSWGANTYGQLGQNNKENSNYAKLVLGEGGSSSLDKIVDISAGSYGSVAVNQFGWVFVWGNGSYGEMGNGSTTTNLTPIKTVLNTGISSSMGAGHMAVISQSGKVYTWGRNSYGELGLGNTSNSTTINKILEGITEVTAAGFETIAKKVDGTVLVAGLNTNGQLATGTTANATTFTTVKLPSTITDTNKVKYIKAGRTSTNIQLADGTVWTVGNNTNGELGNKTNTNSSSFVQAQTKDGLLEDTLIIGRSNGETASLDTAVINESGRVYTSGSNANGQIGDNTKNSTNYFKEMGYIEVLYPEKITMNVGDTEILTGDDLAYVEKYFNVYREDITKVPLISEGKIIDEKIATYEDGTITAKNIGKTMLVVKEETTNTLVYIPVMVVPENGIVVPDVKTGNNFTITLKSNGTVWSFGTNTNGELGLGTNNSINVPEQVELLKDKIVEEISVGNSHTIALTEDGEVYTWGLNTNGQLGVGNTKNSNIPQKVEIPKSTELVPIIEEKVIKVIANKNVSYAITQSGKVYAWGEGYETSPKLLELEADVVDVSNSYALDIDGNVYNLETNTRLEIVEKIKYISEGNTHTVFLSENGTAYGVGSNTYGQFGDGTNVSNETAVVAIRNESLTDVLRDIVKIEAGDGYTVAVLEDGKVVEFGINDNLQLGTDEIDETNTARENTSVTKLLNELSQNIILMDAGHNHVAITLSDGNVYTWGSGENGELGNNTNETKAEVQLVGKNTVEANTNNLLLNENETFSLEAHTTYFNLLQDIQGEISYESKDESVVKIDASSGAVTGISQGTTVIVAKEIGTNNISVVQVRVLPEGIEIEPQVQTNGSHTVTLKVDGTVWSYGNNTNGELGNGTLNYSDEPIQAIFPEGTTIVQVDSGENFSVALDSEGYVWTWGANDYYQLGNSTSSYLAQPTKVSGLSNITKIAAGTYSVLALNENKEIYGWGLNSNGELGIGSYTNKVSTPIKSKYISDIIDIAVGKNHSIALKTTGEVFVTGLNMYGQLGNNDTSIKKVNQFTKVENLSGAARISATDSGNIVANINGDVYTWGLNIYGELGLGDKTNRLVPILVSGIQNIVEVSGGKNHSILLDNSGKAYVSGNNKFGNLGNGTTTESLNYIEVPTLSNVMTVSAGNTYTAVAKTDGTVWGFGDYNHGDKTLKSKTNSAVPMQVGNDSFGLGVTQVTIRKSETVSISASMVYSFNLIYLNQNNTETIKYESINEEIAVVNEYGEVLGVREGFTWVKAIEEDGTEHIVYVYVTDNESNYAPSISAGEDFASVLKSDGSIWTFGHNNNGELGIGSNKTKDIPEKTNVISSYKQVSSGNSFTVAIRNDGTVWSYGKNNFGQLGIGNTKNGLSPVQVNGITDIAQIATGKEHAVAIDSFGILYGWGRNNNGQLGLSAETVLVPTAISYTGGTIRSIWAGENQTIIINTKGKVFGYGSLLNGELEGISNAVKVSVGNGFMLILTTDGNVYKYDGSNLTQYTELAQIVDIDVTNDNIIAQTVNEKIYTFTSNSTPVLETIENVYTIAAGVNNLYIAKTDGTAYARGQNQYGQLGNSTRIDSLAEFTLIGDRKFTVEPESKIMYVNDVEQLTESIVGNEFNVFNRSIRNGEEYTWVSSNPDIVEVNNGELTAKADGTAQITITDNVTGAEVTVTRVVIPVEKDRIESIKVDENQATIKEEYKYYVEVETNGDTATLNITTKDKTDRISIDGGTNWYENGTLTSQIDIPEDENEISIIVETTNGTQIEYTLIVKKIATDVSLEFITVDGITATATTATSYEVVVPESTTLSEILARANSEKAKVSINGEEFIISQATAEIEYKDNTPVIVPIVVQAENGDELEYTLTVYKESSILQLESLTVDGKEAIKTSEGVYSATIARDLSEVEVTAKAVSELVKVSLNSENAEVQVSTKQIKITDEITEVTIRLSTEVDGIKVYRDYILNIYKKAESGKIQFVIVNGIVITPNVDGTYETYLPAETTNATVKVIAQNELDYVQIETNAREAGSSEVGVTTPQDSNKYTIIISDEELTTSEEYTLYIKKPSVDATLKQITVSNGDDIVTAKKSTEEENVYTAKVKSYNDYEIKAITNNINAYVSIDGDTKVKNIATKVVTKTDDYMEVEIEVESENGDLEEYLLKIYIMSSDVSLEYIKVNETEAVLQSDGSYLVNLTTAETSVTVTAGATSEVAEVRLENEDYELHTTTRNVTIDSKDTVKYIYVKAEDGTTAKYKLVISGLPDDATLQKVKVNGVEAKYIEGQNKYEIRSDATSFNVEAIATDSLAKVSLNGETETVGTATTTVAKTGNTTIVTIKVVSQGGIDSSTYTLEIKEKSNDSSISRVIVEGKAATKTADGNYEADVVNSVQAANIIVEANDSYAVVYLDGETQNANNITFTKQLAGRETIYTIKVIAEDGTEESHTLTVTRLEANVNIQELTVSLEVEKVTETVDETTGEVTEETTIIEKTYTPELLADGTYYLKIDRVENVDVKAVLEDVNAKVKIKDSAYVLAENEVTVDTVAEKTTVIISVMAEDGTIKDYTLILEKKSNDTTIKTISSSDMLKLEDYTMYVDETLTETDLTLVTNSSLASIKLDTDTGYTPVQITRTIDLSEETKVENEQISGWLVNVDVLAEDGTIGNYTITILKTGNTNIDTVKVNDETIANIDNTYTARVNVADTAKVEITPQNTGATVEIIQSVEAEDGTVTETVIASGGGTLTADVPLTENPQNYIIRITSAKGTTNYDYSLVLEQKSTDTSLSYVKVNNITTIETTDGYKSVVSGKEEYPVVIKAVDENAQIKISYKDYEGTYSKGKLEEDVPVIEGETLEVTITVQSENGDEQEYKLYITRISHNTALEYVKVEGVTLTNFNADTNTYAVTVNNTLTSSQVEVKTISDKAGITIGSAQGTGIITTSVALDGPGTTKKVTIKVDAEDGTTEYYYIDITQLSASISIENITVNNITATTIDMVNYEVTISNKTGIAEVIANAQEAVSTVSIAGDTATLSTGTKTFTLSGTDTIKTTILITAEDGVTTKEYNLTIYVQDSNAELEYVKLGGANVTQFDESTNTYKVTVDNTLENTALEVKTVSDTAELTIGDQTEVNLLSQTIALNGPGKTTITKIKVTAEDGTTKEYTLEIYQLSNDAELDNITVNGETAILNEESGVYEIEITDSVSVAEIVATAASDTSTVSINGETGSLKIATKTRDITGHEVIEMVINITAEDGTSKDYNLKITVIETSNEVSYVKVNTGEIEPEEDGITYKTFINYNATNANIEIKAESAYANVVITNSSDLVITNENLLNGVLNFTVDTPENVTTINYTVTSEHGESKDYCIILTKISTDNTLKELYVDETLIEVDTDGNYYVDLENAQEVTVKAIANNEYANIRIDYNAEEKHQTEANIHAQNQSTKVTITITSQSGVTAKYYLYIRVLTNNTALDKVIVDSVEITDYVEETNTYTALVDNTKDSYEVFLMAVNDSATVELYDGENLISSGTGSITDIITLETTETGHSYTIKVSIDEEHYSIYTLDIVRTSNDTSLKFVEVNDVIRTPLETDKYVYEVGIPKLAETAKIRVGTTNSFATVKIGDNATVKGGDSVIIDIDLSESRITVPIVVTAVDGTTIDTYNILLIRQSDEANIESVVVNDTELDNVEDVYTYYMSPEEYVANVEITMPVDNNAKIQVDTNEGIGYLEFTENFGANTIKVEKIIKVTSEDGTVEKEYKLIIVKQTQIKGIITTENAEGKHSSQVRLYKTSDTRLENDITDPREIIAEVTTNEDGSYEINVDEIDIYDIVVVKPGYLSYKVTNIEVYPGDIIELDAYKLIAGDTVESGEIQVFDLVALNENFGVVITDENREEKGRYDLNEDGIVDNTDRNILKANYTKLAETVQWVNPNASVMLMNNLEEISTETEQTVESEVENSLETENGLESVEDTVQNENLGNTEANDGANVSGTNELILPIATPYTITSEYGERINPVTEEVSKHTGIDIVGEWHTEILSIADGEVTYVGTNEAFGNCVEIKHIVNGETIYSFYAHLSRIDVEVGEQVAQGQVIGLEGGAESDPNPGYSTGHHLHFEIRKASGYGNDVNPKEYIKF